MSADSTAKLEHLRLRDLLLIERIHELGSLRHVADNMHLTQPAVTQALRNLEDAFGAQLVVRSSGGARLSPTGLAVMQRLKALRWEAMAAHEVARRPESPLITLGVNDSAATALAPAAISTFLQREPGVRVELKEANSPLLWQMLANGALDAIVCRMLAPESFERVREGIVYDVLGMERLVLVAAEQHPLVTEGFTRARLAQQRWVLPPSDSYARNTLNEWFLGADIALPSAAVTSESIETNLRLVAASELVTVTPESNFIEMRGTLKLATVAIDSNWDGFAYVLACRRSGLGNPVLRALREVVVRLGWPAADSRGPA